MKSSLGGHNVDHTTTGSHGRKAIPRAEGTPLDDTYRPTRWPIPADIREWKFNSIRKIHLGALSPGDYFTTALTHRRGWVLAQGRVNVNDGEFEAVSVPLVRSRNRPMGGVFIDKGRPAPIVLSPVTRVEWEGFEGAPGEAVNLSTSVLVVSGWWEVIP